MKNPIGILSAALLLIIAAAVLSNLPQRGGRPMPPPNGMRHPGEPPHFIDRNQDGFNDLAPDHDGDGIPDPLDPDARIDPGFDRWARYRAMPDSVRSDSLLFVAWIRHHHPRLDPVRAWEHWQHLQHETPPCFWQPMGPDCPASRATKRMRDRRDMMPPDEALEEGQNRRPRRRMP